MGANTFTGKNTIYDSDINAGILYKTGAFNFPIEVFAHFNDGYALLNRYGGARGGIEWNATDCLSLRVGYNWPGIREYVRGTDTDSIDEKTFGLGLNFGTFRYDLVLSYSARQDQETEGPILMDMDYSVVKLAADLKAIF